MQIQLFAQHSPRQLHIILHKNCIIQGSSALCGGMLGYSETIFFYLGGGDIMFNIKDQISDTYMYFQYITF